MAKRYYEKDGSLANLKGKTVAIIGYGSQGHAHALNLRDSGVDVVVGLYKGSKSWDEGGGRGSESHDRSDAAKAADVVMILVSDHLQADLYNNEIAPHMTAGKTLMFAHGFCIHFKQIDPPADVDVSMIAPKAPGHRVRELFTEGVGVPALVAVAAESLRQGARARAGVRAGAGMPEGRRDRNHFQRGDGERPVRRAGGAVRRRERADPRGLRDAGRGRLRAGDRLLRVPARAEADCRFDSGRRPQLHAVLGFRHRRIRRLHARAARGQRANARRDEEDPGEVQSGEFARQWIEENKSGRKNFLAMREAARHQKSKQVGRELREMMTFLKKKKEVGVPEDSRRWPRSK